MRSPASGRGDWFWYPERRWQSSANCRLSILTHVGAAILSSLKEVWTYREQTAYPKLFGVPSRGIFPLDAGIFEQIFDVEEVDPRWLHLGVMEFKPTPVRDSWIYVTSGASNPFETEPQDYLPGDYSWLGMEFVIEVPSQADWPIHALHRLLAYQLLVSHGHFGDYDPVTYGDRVPAGGKVDRSEDSQLTFLAIAKPSHYASTVQLDSGIFEFLHVVGITEQERDYAKATSTEELIAMLQSHGAYPVTDPKRTTVV
jgi:hypothetical protein